jgi:leader peptidase (prepilin peptidase) / N-methyltransferase
VEKIIVAAFGLVWGSFLNVVIHRLPRGENIATPPSACPRCGRRIRPYDNIPVVSYLLLGGRCRDCGVRISPVYPLVELLTAAAFLTLYSRFGLSLQLVAACVFAAALIALGFIDFFHQILPDAITLPGLVLALAYAAFRPDLSLRGALGGAVFGGGFLLSVYGAYYLLRKKEGLGLGDVTMMLFVGAFLGWRGTLLTLVLASFSGAFVGAFLIAFRKKDLQHALPFGSFLAPAAFVALVWGDRLVRAYLSLYTR